MGSRMHPYISSQNGLLVVTHMWSEGLLGATGSLRPTERYIGRWTYLPAYSIWWTNNWGDVLGGELEHTKLFFSSILSCWLQHKPNLYIKVQLLWRKDHTYDIYVDSLTFKCCRWRTTPLPSGSKTPNAFSPTFEPSLRIKIENNKLQWWTLKSKHYTKMSFANVQCSAVWCCPPSGIQFRYCAFLSSAPPSPSLHSVSSSESHKC